MDDYKYSIQELVLKNEELDKISTSDLKKAFLSHMRKARHTEGDWIEFKFANLTLQELQTRENAKSLKWSWFFGFITAFAATLLVEIIRFHFLK